jgi:hypothetical protein
VAYFTTYFSAYFNASVGAQTGGMVTYVLRRLRGRKFTYEDVREMLAASIRVPEEAIPAPVVEEVVAALAPKPKPAEPVRTLSLPVPLAKLAELQAKLVAAVEAYELAQIQSAADREAAQAAAEAERRRQAKRQALRALLPRIRQTCEQALREVATDYAYTLTERSLKGVR